MDARKIKCTYEGEQRKYIDLITIVSVVFVALTIGKDFPFGIGIRRNTKNTDLLIFYNDVGRTDAVVTT